jgi:hypothetical protein
MSFDLAAQLVGVVAVLISLAIFQLNKRGTMLKFGMTAAILYAIHFFMLGAVTGAAMNAIGFGRGYVFSKVKPTKQTKWILFAFIAIGAVATALTWQGPLSMLAFGGATAGAIAFWHKTPKTVRHWALIAPPLWFTYNAISGSYPGMFIEVAILSSNLIGQYRLDFTHKLHWRRHFARQS